MKADRTNCSVRLEAQGNRNSVYKNLMKYQKLRLAPARFFSFNIRGIKFICKFSAKHPIK